jgi:hypothetical protein
MGKFEVAALSYVEPLAPFASFIVADPHVLRGPQHTNGPRLWGPDHWHPRAYKRKRYAPLWVYGLTLSVCAVRLGKYLLWTTLTRRPGPFCGPAGDTRCSNIDCGTLPSEGAWSGHTQHHDRPSYALMAFCQSIITLVARRGLIDGLGPCGSQERDRPWHLRLAAHRCRYGVSRTAWALDPRCRG